MDSKETSINLATRPNDTTGSYCDHRFSLNQNQRFWRSHILRFSFVLLNPRSTKRCTRFRDLPKVLYSSSLEVFGDRYTTSVTPTAPSLDYSKLVGTKYPMRYRPRQVLWLGPEAPHIVAYHLVETERGRFLENNTVRASCFDCQVSYSVQSVVASGQVFAVLWTVAQRKKLGPTQLSRRSASLLL